MGAFLVLSLVAAAMVMFAWERIPLEVASLALLLALAASGVLSPAEAFAGIANETVIFIFTLLAMTQGLASTGVMQIVGRRTASVGRLGERGFIAALAAVVAGISSIASNTAVTAAFLPVASAASSRARISPRRVLLPMAYASMLGGMILLFGTSTNLVVSESMVRLGLAPIGFAELAPAGIPAAVVAIAGMAFAGRHLVADRTPRTADAGLAHRVFLTEASLVPGSRLLGTSAGAIADQLDLDIVGVVRRDRILPPAAVHRVSDQDRLLIRGSRRMVLRLKDLRSLVLEAELHDPPPSRPPRNVIAEVFVPPHSRLVGLNVSEGRIQERLGIRPLAIHRHPTLEPETARSLSRVRLAPGDVLLCSGPPDRFRALEGGETLVVLGGVGYQRPRYRKALLAVVIFAGAIATAASGLVAPAVAGLAGMLAMIGTGCMDAGEAFRVEWRVVLLVGSLLALGAAMERSGAGTLVAQQLVPLGLAWGPRVALAAVMVLTVVLSAPMSNQAAALVVLPIAVHTAEFLAVSPRPFAIATCLAASCSFITPLEPSAALVYGPGHYRFVDFIRAGTPLTLVLLALFALLIPWVWPLAPAGAS